MMMYAGVDARLGLTFVDFERVVGKIKKSIRLRQLRPVTIATTPQLISTPAVMSNDAAVYIYITMHQVKRLPTLFHPFN